MRHRFADIVSVMSISKNALLTTAQSGWEKNIITIFHYEYY